MIQEIRCSSLNRAMNCLGYLDMKDLDVIEAGQPAKDGTAAGELLSEMILQKTDTPNVKTTATNGVYFDNDMWFYARETYNIILKNAKGSLIETEERIDWSTESGVKIRGQFDISYALGDTLYIEDLKYGYGIVDVKDNWQLIGYAIGQYFRLYAKSNGSYKPSNISMTIHQPRAYHQDGTTRIHVITIQELFEYYNKINARLMEYKNGNNTLSTSKSCKYCAAANNCPALSRSVYAAVETVMSDWKQDTMSNDAVSKELSLLERVSELVKIKKDSLEQLATIRLQNNQIVPGYVFEMSYGDRKWKDGVSAASIKAFTGIDITKVDIMSPNQAEKAGVNKKLTSHLTTKVAKGAKLVKKDVLAEAAKIFTKPEEV